VALSRCTVHPAALSDKPIIKEQLTHYLRELSQFGDVGEDYPYVDRYWQAGGQRWPYLIRLGAEVAGFALVNTHSATPQPVDFAMAEFFVQSEQRGAGIGLAAAEALFARHPGRWEIAVMVGNHPARRFWQRVLERLSVGDWQSSEVDDMIVHRFAAP
jgi:predicted acetyltransferase